MLIQSANQPKFIIAILQADRRPRGSIAHQCWQQIGPLLSTHILTHVVTQGGNQSILATNVLKKVRTNDTLLFIIAIIIYHSIYKSGSALDQTIISETLHQNHSCNIRDRSIFIRMLGRCNFILGKQFFYIAYMLGIQIFKIVYQLGRNFF